MYIKYRTKTQNKTEKNEQLNVKQKKPKSNVQPKQQTPLKVMI